MQEGDISMSNKAKIREDAMKLNPIDDALFCKMAEDIQKSIGSRHNAFHFQVVCIV